MPSRRTTSSTRFAWRSAAVLAGGALLATCSRERAHDGAWSGSVDTLGGGAVVVHSPAAGVWSRDQAWRIEQDLRIGAAEGEGPDVFGQVGDVAVDPAGRIYVLDAQAQEIRVFDAQGRYVRTLGRKGGGPGELRGATGMGFAPDARLWVVDPDAARYSVWDTAGAFVAAYRRPETAVFGRWQGGFDHAGRLYDVGAVFDVALTTARRTVFQGRHAILFQLRDSAVVADSFPLPELEVPVFPLTLRSGNNVSRMLMAVPFAPTFVWKIDPRGYLVSAITDRYRVVYQTFRGDTVRIVEPDYEPVPVTDADREREVESFSEFRKMGGDVDVSRFGKTHPAVGGLYVDDRSYLWIRPTLPEKQRTPGGVTFDVFDPDGCYLGMARTDFTIPGVMVVRGDNLYAMVLDSLDVPYVVRGRIRNR
jgi:hypothetical protein